MRSKVSEKRKIMLMPIVFALILILSPLSAAESNEITEEISIDTALHHIGDCDVDDEVVRGVPCEGTSYSRSFQIDEIPKDAILSMDVYGTHIADSVSINGERVGGLCVTVYSWVTFTIKVPSGILKRGSNTLSIISGIAQMLDRGPDYDDFLIKNIKLLTKINVHDKIVQIAENQKNKSYERAAEGPNKFDCSGLVWYAYDQAGVKIDRKTADEYYKLSEEISEGKLQKGDLVFLYDKTKKEVYHVGIYVGEDFVISAIEEEVYGTDRMRNKVTNSRLRSDYYSWKEWVGRNSDTRALYFGRLVADGGITVNSHSPVDLVVTDPYGYVVSKQVNEISWATYFELDLDGDGNLDDQIIIPIRKVGDYQIMVEPEPYAWPTDIYSLEVSAGDTTMVLAENVPISDIPSEGYGIRSTGTTIELRLTELTISPASFTLQPEDSITLTATLTYNGIPLAGKPITWSTVVGGISPSSGTTDFQGQVEVTYTPPTVDTSTSVTISASFAGDNLYGLSSDNSSGIINPSQVTDSLLWIIIAIIIFAIAIGAVAFVKKWWPFGSML